MKIVACLLLLLLLVWMVRLEREFDEQNALLRDLRDPAVAAEREALYSLPPPPAFAPDLDLK